MTEYGLCSGGRATKKAAFPHLQIFLLFLPELDEGLPECEPSHLHLHWFRIREFCVTIQEMARVASLWTNLLLRAIDRVGRQVMLGR